MVGERAVLYQAVGPVGKRQQPSDARDAARGRDVAPLWPFGREVDADYGPGRSRRHGATSAASSPNPASRHWIDIVPAPPS